MDNVARVNDCGVANLVVFVNTNEIDTTYYPPGCFPCMCDSLDIYIQDAQGNKYGAAAVEATSPVSYILPLAYAGTGASGAVNQIYFEFSDFGGNLINDDFPSNALITAKVVTQNYTNAVDVKKAIALGTNGYYGGTYAMAYWTLPNSSGGTNGQVYGTNTVKFVPLNEQTKGRITGIARASAGPFTSQYTISADLPNGTSNTLYRSNSPSGGGSGTAVTNVYAPVTVQNFDSGTGTYTFTDIVSNNVSSAFWSIGESAGFQ